MVREQCVENLPQVVSEIDKALDSAVDQQNEARVSLLLQPLSRDFKDALLDVRSILG